MTDENTRLPSEHDAILAALHAFERSEKPAPFNQMKDAIEAYRTALSQTDEQPETARAVSKCAKCGAEYPSAPAGTIHKCGMCSGGHCVPVKQPEMDRLAGELEAYTKDWDGSDMPDGCPTRTEPTCGEMRKWATALRTRTDRKAVLEEAVKAVSSCEFHEGLCDASVVIRELRALAEGAGK